MKIVIRKRKGDYELPWVATGPGISALGHTWEDCTRMLALLLKHRNGQRP